MNGVDTVKFVMSLVVLCMSISLVHAKLEISNIQPAHGLLGPARADEHTYPNDEYIVRFAINGIKTTADNKIDCELSIRLVNMAGKAVVDTKAPLQRVLSLGEGKITTFAAVSFPAVAPPGVYVLNVSVRDKLGNETVSFERKLTCKPVEFQILSPRFSNDPEGKQQAGAIGIVGQMLYYRFKIVGHEKTKKLSLTMTAEILDKAGKPIDAKPIVVNAETTEADKLASPVPPTFNGAIMLHREGEFTLRVTVKDNVADKKTTFEAPLRVITP